VDKQSDDRPVNVEAAPRLAERADLERRDDWTEQLGHLVVDADGAAAEAFDLDDLAPANVYDPRWR
jgi:hypothetical protein